MIQQELEIINKLGLHARASAKFTQLAAKHKSDVWMTRNARRVNAKSIMGVMMLAAGKGAKVTIETDGGDEADPLRAQRLELVDVADQALAALHGAPDAQSLEQVAGVGHVEPEGRAWPFEVWANGPAEPRGLGAVAKTSATTATLAAGASAAYDLARGQPLNTERLTKAAAPRAPPSRRSPKSS